MVNIYLEKAQKSEAQKLLEIQKICFMPLYEKYHDEQNPIFDTQEKILMRMEFCDYYKIMLDNEIVGAITIFKKSESEYLLQRIFVLPDFRNRGIAQKAIKLAEEKYEDAVRWELDVPEDLPGNRRVYEKSGYMQCGKRVISDKLLLIDYQKFDLSNTVFLRKYIINLLKNYFIEADYVNAMWLEGSDGLGKSDEYSDIDFWFDAEDGYENDVLEKCIELLQTINELDFIEHYEHPHPKIYQKNAHIKGTSEFLMIDICVQSNSRGSEGCTFIKGDIAEFPLVLFDKKNIIKILDGITNGEYFSENCEQIKNEKNKIVSVFSQQSRAIKYIKRKKFLEAHAYYTKYVCGAVVDLLRILYTPRHSEYGLVHFSEHFPRDIVDKVELLYKVSTLENIENNIVFANNLFNETLKKLEEKF